MSQSAFGACPEDVLLFLRSLDPVEDAPGDEVDRHVADCPRCRARLEALRVEANTMRAEGAAGHVPAGILARWSAGRADLPPASQRAVERHLERCERCSGELASLARIRSMAEEFDLTTVTDRPEPAPVFAERATSTAALGSVQFRRRVAASEGLPVDGEPSAAPAKRRGSSWLLGGYSVLATAAALALALRGPLSAPPVARPTAPVTNPVPAPSATASPPAPAVEPSPAPAPVVPAPAPDEPSYQVTMLPKGEPVLTSTMRGAGDGSRSRVIGTDDGSDALVVRIEPTFQIPDDAVVVVELRTGDGSRLLSRSRAPWKAFHGAPRILLTRHGNRLPAGDYMLRLTPQPGEGVPPEELSPIDYRFEVGAGE